MSGHRGDTGSKPTREIFLTSSSLSFSSLSSSVSWDDAFELNIIELNSKESITSSEENGELSNGSDISSVTHIRMQSTQSPDPSSKLQPVPLMNKGLGNYNPERIPASVFAKSTGDLNWSDISNDSLFSLKVDGYRNSNAQASRQSNLKPEEVLMTGEFLRYTPCLLVKPGDAKHKRSHAKEVKSGDSGLESCSHQETSLSTPDVLSSNNSYGLDQVTKVQSFSIHVGDKKSKKRKKTRKSKKKKNKEKEKEKKKKECYMWSWLCSVFSKCECGLRYYTLRKCFCCSRGPKTMVL